MKLTIPACSALVALLLAATVRADDDRYSVDANFPLRLEDAFPTDDAYLKLSGQYAESDAGHGTTTLQPEVAVGVAPRLDVHVFAPFLIGGDDRTGGGVVTVNTQVLALEQREGDPWPSVGVEVGADFPTGVNAHGIDPSVQLIATQTLSWSPTFDAIHLDVEWQHNAAPTDDERADAYSIILGYSRRVAPDTAVLADAFWERTTTQGEAGQGVEVGVIRRLGEHVLVAGAVGVGLGDDADRYTATLAIEFTK